MKYHMDKERVSHNESVEKHRMLVEEKNATQAEN